MSKPDSSSADTDASPRQVLYVEDDRINIILMEEVFRRLPGWTLCCAEDGAQAQDLLQEMQPDLVLIDMNLPDMNGMELLARLRADARWQALPCVALSADGYDEQIQAALAAGFRDYWLKPIEVPRLQAALRDFRAAH
jgi:CheY-like chemotaxis protein